MRSQGRIIDLNTSVQAFYIYDPKGRGTLTSSGKMDLTMRGSIYLLERYLQKRSVYLASRNTDSLWLFLYVEIDGTSHPYAHQTIDRMITDVNDGVDFHFFLKTFRATVTCLMINADPAQVPNTSRQLQHNPWQPLKGTTRV